MEDLITVIVPIYNRDKYLHETILSVINQTHKNLEIFLVDDGSSDNALRIISYYEKMDKRINVITQKNMGICLTMKKILSLSKGKYFARVDSDDVNELDRYESQLRYLKENNFDMVGCYIKSFGSAKEGQKTYLEKCVNKRMRTYEEQRDRIVLGQPITGSTMLCKTEVLKEVAPFDEKYSIVEDYYLSVMLHKAGKRISILEEEKLNYRVHSENLSLSDNKYSLNKHTEISFLHVYHDFIKKSNNIVIFRKEKEKEDLLRILGKIFKGELYKFKIITENEVDEFFKNNFGDFVQEKDGLIFFGFCFSDIVKPLIEYGRYEFLKNIFLSGN